MPVNPGDIEIATRDLTKHAAASIDDVVRWRLESERRRVAMLYAATEVAFGAWHGERYRQSTTEGLLMDARREFEVPILTETPVDRWMDRIRGRPQAAAIRPAA